MAEVIRGKIQAECGGEAVRYGWGTFCQEHAEYGPCSLPGTARWRPGEGQSSLEHLCLCVSPNVSGEQESFSGTQFLPLES